MVARLDRRGTLLRAGFIDKFSCDHLKRCWATPNSDGMRPNTNSPARRLLLGLADTGVSTANQVASANRAARQP
jgi:hypothetical protein